MKKRLIICLMCFMLLCAFSSHIYTLGSDIDMELSDNSANATANPNDNITIQDTTPVLDSPVSIPKAARNNHFFTAENILSVILITIGIVLILLAIAIFIRIK